MPDRRRFNIRWPAVTGIIAGRMRGAGPEHADQAAACTSNPVMTITFSVAGTSTSAETSSFR